jgi:hypothetical protein
MNIITIRTGCINDPEYEEYLFKTEASHQRIFDSDLNLTPEFIEWLKQYNYNNIVNQYLNNRKYFSIDFWYEDNFDEVYF